MIKISEKMIMLKLYKPYKFIQKAIFISSAFVSGLVVADGNNHHSNADAIDAAPQEYQDVYLTMDKDSNWETEYCLTTKKGTFKYHFEAPHITSFGTHLHTDTGTEVQVRDALVREYSASITIDSDGGDFCFTWAKTKNYDEDWPFQLRYWVNE